jgi:hypothetical protein
VSHPLILEEKLFEFANISDISIILLVSHPETFAEKFTLYLNIRVMSFTYTVFQFDKLPLTFFVFENIECIEVFDNIVGLSTALTFKYCKFLN